jgi:hypothetical protein
MTCEPYLTRYSAFHAVNGTLKGQLCQKMGVKMKAQVTLSEDEIRALTISADSMLKAMAEKGNSEFNSYGCRCLKTALIKLMKELSDD